MRDRLQNSWPPRRQYLCSQRFPIWPLQEWWLRAPTMAATTVLLRLPVHLRLRAFCLWLLLSPRLLPSARRLLLSARLSSAIQSTALSRVLVALGGREIPQGGLHAITSHDAISVICPLRTRRSYSRMSAFGGKVHIALRMSW